MKNETTELKHNGKSNLKKLKMSPDVTDWHA